MPHQLRIEDAGVAAAGSTGGGLATSRHAPGNPVAGTPMTTTTAGSTEPEAPAAPKPPQEDAEKFTLEAMNFPGINSPQDARAAWAERLFEIAKNILRGDEEKEEAECRRSARAVRWNYAAVPHTAQHG